MHAKRRDGTEVLVAASQRGDLASEQPGPSAEEPEPQCMLSWSSFTERTGRYENITQSWLQISLRNKSTNTQRFIIVLCVWLVLPRARELASPPAPPCQHGHTRLIY